ncbi:hypothetical protein HanIR_Chr03g0128121 [Helianthus annuus]|nr:hypothetical protein HanIR_Chr03g0128121 [Helianthus annuus]
MIQPEHIAECLSSNHWLLNKLIRCNRNTIHDLFYYFFRFFKQANAALKPLPLFSNIGWFIQHLLYTTTMYHYLIHYLHLHLLVHHFLHKIPQFER